MKKQARAILKQYWGYDEFRPLQEEIIFSVLEGNDTLALMPTGGGKSICFQVPAMMSDGLCLVITPLVALMIDQVANLRARNIPAAEIHSGMHRNEIEFVVEKAAQGALKFLYVSPERLVSRRFTEVLRYLPVNLVAIDEAHCISQWGYDFRPPYLEIAKVRAYFPGKPVLALTATAVPKVIDDIQERLEFRKKNVLSKSFFRSNLAYVVSKEDDKLRKLVKVCKGIQGCGIVYVRNRKLTKEYAAYLSKEGIASGYYHAGMDGRSREGSQQDWMKGKVRVIVATNAFGMGIDKPDVRFVVHMDLPDSLEAYFQEAGRAGRDGRKSYAVVLYNNSDVANAQHSFELSWPEPETVRNIYQALGNFLQLPVGGGRDCSFDFDLEHFSSRYKFRPVQVYSALRILERDGYLVLNDALENPSKVYITCSNEEVYRYQAENPESGKILKTILRSYAGLFTDYVKIHEEDLARKTGVETRELVRLLERMKTQGVLDYLPRKNGPQLVFVSDMLARQDVVLSKTFYSSRKKDAATKLEAVIRYLTGNSCRSQSLLAYFGEEKSETCGICDVCLGEKKKAMDADRFSMILAAIVSALEQGPRLLRDVVDQSGLPEKEVLKVIRMALDEGLLVMEGEWLLKNTD